MGILMLYFLPFLNLTILAFYNSITIEYLVEKTFFEASILEFTQVQSPSYPSKSPPIGRVSSERKVSSTVFLPGKFSLFIGVSILF